VLLLRLPGVYEPQSDTDLLIDAISDHPMPLGARALDVGTGTGRAALALKAAGAAAVEAVDISRRAVWAARLNSLVNRLPVRVHHGDLLARTTGAFDLIVANPPYVPCATGMPARHSRTRAWDAGVDGRLVLDRLCTAIPARLRPGGALLLVHSALCSPERTLEVLGEAGLHAAIVRTAEIPFGPVMRSRTVWLREQGLITPDQDTEELVVIRGWRDA
jgi:release factor glutamine methyltransferase